MAGLLFWLVNVVIVVMATGAPMAYKENAVAGPADSMVGNEASMRVVSKRADEMLYFGNQQNDPRVAVKKSDTSFIEPIVKPPGPEGEVDEGSNMVGHQSIPVQDELNDRAEALKVPSELERIEEGMKVAQEQVEGPAESESGVKDKKEDEAVGEDGEVNEEVATAGDESNNDVAVALPENDVSSDDVSAEEPASDTDMEMLKQGEEGNDNNDDENDDDNDAYKELASLSEEENSSSENDGDDDDNDGEDDNDSSNDAEVEEFLDELRKESEDADSGGDDDGGDERDGDVSNDMKAMKEVSGNNGVDPNYYQTLYHILANTYRGGPSDDYYNNYNTMVPYYVRRRRRSSLHRRDLASIRSRGRGGHVRRIKRDLPSDWLAAYRGIDIPYSDEDLKDSLLSDEDDTYEDKPVNEELSRYIYANLLNKIYGGGLDADVEEEVPYEEILPYELGQEIPASLIEEYEPEDLMYNTEVPKVYRENPYEDYVPSYESYSKRSGAGYYPDASRRKRYFYPVYEEPETHWGAFVPEKRSNYDDAIQRLQRLAFALSDNPRPYYETLLREYRKK